MIRGTEPRFYKYILGGGRAQILQVHTGTPHLQGHNTWAVPSPRASRLISTLVYFIVTLFFTRVFFLVSRAR